MNTVHKKTFEGEVVSNSMTNMIVVEITEKSAHPIYKKILTHHKKIKAAVSAGMKMPQVGDMVKIESCRPISKTCSFKLIK